MKAYGRDEHTMFGVPGKEVFRTPLSSREWGWG